MHTVYICLLCSRYLIPEGLIEKGVQAKASVHIAIPEGLIEKCLGTGESICVHLSSGFKSKAGKVPRNAITLKRCRAMDKG